MPFRIIKRIPEGQLFSLKIILAPINLHDAGQCFISLVSWIQIFNQKKLWNFPDFLFI